MTHKGIRPEYALVRVDYKRRIYMEQFEDGGYRIWNMRMLKSGCGVSLREVDEVKEMMDCIYCPTCKEWFNVEQWEDM
jgi:uncharacterized protein YbaR (Trm112 family)